MIVDLENYLKQAKPRWDQLENLLMRLEQPGSVLSVEECQEFRQLYDSSLVDLSELKHFAFEREVCQHLENIISRCSVQMMPQAKSSGRWSPFTWLRQTFPMAFRRRFNAFLLSVAVTLTGCLFGAGAIAFDPPSKGVIMPFPHLLMTPTQRVKMEEKRISGNHPIDENRAAFSAQLMTHNSKVSITTMAFGLTYGVGTVVMLFYNGVILGGVCADFLLDGQRIFLVGWLLPHGAIEIPAILLAGQAGMILAWAMLDRRQGKSMGVRLGKVLPDVSTIIVGVALMLVWAGIVESFLSQYHEPILPYSIKIGFGLMELVGLMAYLGLCGRTKATS